MRIGSRPPIVIVLVTSFVVITTAAQAGGLTPTPLVTGPRSQFGGSGNADYLAWTQYEPATKGYDVWVRPTGGSKFKVDGAEWGFADAVNQTGSWLAWQSIENDFSDINLFDMASQTSLILPLGINTVGWECCSGLFGNTLAFVRATNDDFKLFLADLTTGEKIKFKTINRPTWDFYGSLRIYGNWVVWTQTKANDWRVFRYDITNDLVEKIPNPLGKLYYAGSVDLAGNVYLVRSGIGCATNVKLMKWTGIGKPTIVYTFDDQTDVAQTSVFDDGLGTVTLFADFIDCTVFKADIYSFTNP